MNKDRQAPDRSAGRVIDRAAADYLEYALDIFRQAQRLSGETARQSFVMADLTVEMNFAGQAMARHVSHALAHLKTADVAKPHMALHIWDCATTGSPPLHPKWSLEDYGAHGLIRGFNNQRFHAAIQFDPLILRLVDNERGLGIYWTKSAHEMPYYEVGAPLRPLLHDWLQRKGLLPIHGGAVGFKEGGVLLAGSGGAGKSNAALCCLNSELLYLSDDFCVLSENPWVAHSLYSTGKLHSDSLVRVPHLLDSISNADKLETEKALFFLNERFADRLIRNFPLRAILLPRLCPGEQTRLAPVSTASAQKALASTIELSPASAALTFRKAASLVRALPCYALRVGGPVEEIPTLVAGLLSELNRASRVF